MSESSVSVSSPEEDIVISSSSSSRSGRVSTSSSEVGTSSPKLLRPLSSEPLRPSSSQPLQPSSSQRSLSLPAKNALGDVKDQAEDEANPRPWYTVDEKSSKMPTEDLVELLREYPLPVGWYARLPGLQEPANYGTKYETGIYKEQVRSGYRLPLHPFALCFFEHYHMAPGQLVPNGWRKLVGLIYLVQTSGYKSDPTNFMRVFFEICFVKGVANCPGWYYIHSRQRLLKGGQSRIKVGTPDTSSLAVLIKGSFRLKESGILTGGLSIDEPLSEQQLEWARIIPRTLVPAGAVTPPHVPTISSTFLAESASLGVLLNRLLVPVFVSMCILVLIVNSFAEMASGSGKTPQRGFLGVLQKAKGKRREKQPSTELPPALEKTRVIPPDHSPQIVEKVSVEEDPIFRPRWTLRSNDVGMPDSQISEQHLVHGVLPRDKEIFQNQTHETFACSFAQAVYTMYARRSEMLSRFEMARQVAADEAQQKREAVKEAQEASHRAEGLSNREEDYLAKIANLEKRLERIKRKAAEEAKEMFAERFLDIPLEDFVLPAVVSLSRETAMPSEAGDAAASHPPGEGPSGDAPEP
ncbi:hypothetical protein RJ639_041349 [Escallonia herrerae]|uniref:Transposase (putative) gypsy type domain-containing protein n=1 Tax=Escallonia herrerae TaxID=1293975 RepID=A0AA88WHP3_9ASTE|nr:hypothetical protein RJ639_041349 [Escallonia herrerae]